MDAKSTDEAAYFNEHASQTERNFLRKFLSLSGHFEAISKVDVQNLNEQNDKEDAQNQSAKAYITHAPFQCIYEA